MSQSGNPVVKALLAPLTILYGAGVFVRNRLFDLGLLRSRDFPFPVISVGNITVGGTGKTPHVEHILSLLCDDFRLAVLSRGYKRKSRGFVLASVLSGAEDVGDEPLQIKRKYPGAEVAVDGNRVRGIKKLYRINHNLDAVILDDAFQHRWVKPGVSVLLVDYNRPITTDTLLPSGRLREFVSSKNRAAIIVVTKCPAGIKPIERRIISKELDLFPWQSLYFTSVEYDKPVPVFAGCNPFPEREISDKDKTGLLLITGIVSPGDLKRHLGGIARRIEHLVFPDHHDFTGRDIKRIGRVWESLGKGRKIAITTEKDAMRLQKFGNITTEIKHNLYYVPIRINFVEGNGDAFKNQITDYVRKDKRDHILC